MPSDARQVLEMRTKTVGLVLIKKRMPRKRPFYC